MINVSGGFSLLNLALALAHQEKYTKSLQTQ